MDSLYNLLQPLLDHQIFAILIDLVVLANIVALAPQVWTVIRARSANDLAGISVKMWLLFAAIQMSLVLNAVKLGSPSLFVSMLISFFESMTIIVIVIKKRS